jgi:hypothetical protein
MLLANWTHIYYDKEFSLLLTFPSENQKEEKQSRSVLLRSKRNAVGSDANVNRSNAFVTESRADIGRSNQFVIINNLKYYGNLTESFRS